AKLLKLPDGYYIAVTTYQNKTGGEQQKYKSPIGIDMGIKTSITLSDGRKYKILIEEPERLKRLQRMIMRRMKGSSNRYKACKLLEREYQKLTNRKRDAANKIIHELLEHERIYMQDENITGWHKGLFGRTVQHSILGLVKAKLIKNERVIILPKSAPTTKYCPVCGKLKKDITLADRVYQCECGYQEDRDVHAARNMILLSKQNTCGTHEINAYGEDVRRLQPTRVERGLVELGSSRFYKRG
ncbi:MAG: transposase, partial [Synergistaceae bacterium]|nr:transposase [Synergistaceae bacterium]